MAFGTPSDEISVKESNKVDIAKKVNGKGEILNYTTHGGEKTVTEEVYADAITNEAVNGQTGTTAVTEHGIDKSNSDYSKATKTRVTALGAGTGATTTTTTGA